MSAHLSHFTTLTNNNRVTCRDWTEATLYKGTVYIFKDNSQPTESMFLGSSSTNRTIVYPGYRGIGKEKGPWSIWAPMLVLWVLPIEGGRRVWDQAPLLDRERVNAINAAPSMASMAAIGPKPGACSCSST